MVGLLTAALLMVGDSHTEANQPWVVDSFAYQLGGVNLARSGATVATTILDFQDRVGRYLVPNAVVHVMLGTNDSIYGWVSLPHWEAELDALVSQICGDSRIVVLSAPWWAGPGYAQQRIFEITVAVVARWGTSCIHTTGYLGIFNPPELEDMLHPSQAGHNHIADALSTVLP